jgi:predicted dehydrogenase
MAEHGPTRLTVGVLKVGIIGASRSGGWALQSHLPALAALPGVQLTALSTTRAESAAVTAAEFGAAGAYTDPASLVADPNVDLVSVVVKIPDHDAGVRAVIDAGKPVYCEAPLGADSRRAEQLRDAAAAAGVRTVIGLQARLQPSLLQARQLIADGYVGRVLSARVFSAGNWLGGDEVPANREWSLDRRNGLSVLSVRTAHTLDALAFCVSPIVEVAAVVAVATPRPLIADTSRHVTKTSPDQALVNGRLESGATFDGQFLLGVWPVATPLLTVYGSSGTLTVRAATADGQIQMSRLSLVGQRRDGPPEQLSRTDDCRIDGRELSDAALSVARMYAAVRDSWHLASLTTPTFDDAAGVHRMLDVIQRSADEKRRLAL